MQKSKGRLIKFPSSHEAKEGGEQRRNRRIRLRSNEWQRLQSLRNKQEWKKELTPEDNQDLKTIQAIEEERLKPYRPELLYYNAACTGFRKGKLFWLQDSESEPLRELSSRERRMWDIVGPWDLFGFIRPDGSIQPYVLSGWDRIAHLLASAPEHGD
jgi:hypothetical protein